MVRVVGSLVSKDVGEMMNQLPFSLFKDFVDAFFHQFELIHLVTIKGASIDAGSFSQLLDGDGLKSLFLNETKEGIFDQLLRPDDA